MLVAASACRDGTDDSVRPNVTPSVVPVGPHDFAGVAWVGDWLVVGLNPKDVSAANQVWRLRVDGRGFRRVPLPNDTACTRTDYLSPQSLPDGRVGLVKACFLDLDKSPPIPISYSLVAVSPLDDEVTGLVTTEPLGYLRSFEAPGLTVSPDMSMAIVSAGNILCESLVLVDARGVRYLPVEVTGEEGSWSLDEYFRSDADLCTDLGRAWGAAWSPDGEEVAFLGSPQSIGVAGMARLDVPWNIYLMDPRTWTPRVVLADVSDPSELSWSPDSRWFAFSGLMEGKGQGTWLFNPQDGKLKRLTTAQLASPVWSPDGRSIVGTLPVEGSGSREELVTVDASGLVSLP